MVVEGPFICCGEGWESRKEGREQRGGQGRWGTKNDKKEKWKKEKGSEMKRGETYGNGRWEGGRWGWEKSEAKSLGEVLVRC